MGWKSEREMLRVEEAWRRRKRRRGMREGGRVRIVARVDDGRSELRADASELL